MIQEAEHKRVENYLLSGRKLTALRCLEKFNVQRLAVVINRMRNKGINVITETIKTPHSNKRIARYYVQQD